MRIKQSKLSIERFEIGRDGWGIGEYAIRMREKEGRESYMDGRYREMRERDERELKNRWGREIRLVVGVLLRL